MAQTNARICSLPVLYVPNALDRPPPTCSRSEGFNKTGLPIVRFGVAGLGVRVWDSGFRLWGFNEAGFRRVCVRSF